MNHIRKSALLLLLSCGTSLHVHESATQDIIIGLSGIWATSQLSELLVKLRTHMDPYSPHNVEVQYIDKSLNSDQIDELSHIIQEVEDIHGNIRLLYEKDIDEANATIDTDSEETIWIAYGNFGPVCLHHNLVLINDDFMQLSYKEKRAMLRHEIWHATHKHIERTARASATAIPVIISALYTLPTSIFSNEIPYSVQTFEAIGRLTAGCALSFGGMFIVSSEAKKWHEIEADLAAQAYYEDMYTGNQKLERMYAQRISGEEINIDTDSHETESTPRDKIPGANSIFESHQTNETRYDYMRHVHETGKLPWYIIIRPAYWLGRTAIYLGHLLEYCNSSPGWLLHPSVAPSVDENDQEMVPTYSYESEA